MRMRTRSVGMRQPGLGPWFQALPPARLGATMRGSGRQGVSS